MALSKKTSPRTKVTKTKKESTAGLEVADNAIRLIGDAQHLINVDSTGTTIYGPISLAADSASIRRGGLFIGTNDFLKMIPSTVITPQGEHIPVPPFSGPLGIVQSIAFFWRLLT